jgi:hypothetical protein
LAICVSSKGCLEDEEEVEEEEGAEEEEEEEEDRFWSFVSVSVSP